MDAEDLFSREQQLRDEGRAKVESHHPDWLWLARQEAARICARKGSVSAVEVHEWAERTGIRPESPLAYSAVFRGKAWKPTGEFSQSRHRGGHARRVMRWRLR